MHLPTIIQDLAIILIVGAAMALLFRAIRQPVVLGYIVAGFLVGPHFAWMPTIVETESIKVWAEIGVIFLLFALGLEFSFKKLVRVGGPASITALVEVAGMSVIGYLVGKAFGWGKFDSLFLGGILAISSTTIIIRAFEELDMKTMGFVRLVFGVLIIEDLFAILLMVLLSTIAVSQQFSGVEMSIASVKLGFFLMLWFVFGIFLIPSFLNKIKHLIKEETLLIVAVGLCFFMVIGASKVGFSPALGAFIMGSVLAETTQSERIGHIIEPVKNLFGAIFFVSVGMLIDPGVLIHYTFPILVITAVTISGKIVTSAFGALIAGQSLRHSIQAGFSLAQIGEFSFIIAGLGLSLNVTSEFLYPIAISVSAITTFTTPYLIRASDDVVSLLERKLPRRWLDNLERFRVSSAIPRQTDDWKRIVKADCLKILANSVIVIAFFQSIARFLMPWLKEQEWSDGLSAALGLFLALLASTPFLWAIADPRVQNLKGRPGAQGSGFNAPMFIFQILRGLFAIALCAALTSLIVAPAVAMLIVLGLIVANFLLLSRYFEQTYRKLEGRFIQNLNEKESHDRKRGMPRLAPWDSHLVELLVSADSPLVGRTFEQLRLRERFGITIALIQRGKAVIIAPGKDTVIYPADILHVIGSDDQIIVFRRECEFAGPQAEAQLPAEYILRPVYVSPEAPFINKSIRDSGIRESTHGLVVGIEKNGARTLNPESSVVIEPGDVLWIVGDQSKLELFS
jgi:CPA2 family monovalent cation:H+ antiporter-2